MHTIAPGLNPPDDINVLIEIPQGGMHVKYEWPIVSASLEPERYEPMA